MDDTRVPAIVPKLGRIFKHLAEFPSHSSRHRLLEGLQGKLVVAAILLPENVAPELQKFLPGGEGTGTEQVLSRRRLDQCAHKVAAIFPGVDEWNNGVAGSAAAETERTVLLLLEMELIIFANWEVVGDSP